MKWPHLLSGINFFQLSLLSRAPGMRGGPAGRGAYGPPGGRARSRADASSRGVRYFCKVPIRRDSMGLASAPLLGPVPMSLTGSRPSTFSTDQDGNLGSLHVSHLPTCRLVSKEPIIHHLGFILGIYRIPYSSLCTRTIVTTLSPPRISSYRARGPSQAHPQEAYPCPQTVASPNRALSSSC